MRRAWCWYSFTDVINAWMQTREKNECESCATEINWGLGGAQREVCVCVRACLHAWTFTASECKRWITMETDCQPVGKQSNYDTLGSKVRAVLRTGPLAIRYSSILHCITWPITLCVSEWFIAAELDCAWQAVGNVWVIVLYVLRWSLIRLTHTAHKLVCC